MYKTHSLCTIINHVKVVEYKKYGKEIGSKIQTKKYFSWHFDLCKSNLKEPWRVIGVYINKVQNKATNSHDTDYGQ